MSHRCRFFQVLAELVALLPILAASQALAAASFTTFYNFQPNAAEPLTGLVADSAGNLYGVDFPPNTGGAIYQLSPPAQQGGTWTYTTLFALNGTSDGNEAYSGLVIDSKGNLYGNTFGGGSGVCTVGGVNVGCGVVFELSKSGGNWTETVLYNFQGGKDGRNPSYSPMTFDPNGNLYGTTNNGGGTGCGGEGCGVLFKLTPAQGGGSWTETVLHRFTKSQGTFPQGKLLDLGGILYGTTGGGGAFGHGTVYRSTLNGAVTVIHSFNGTPEGSDNFSGGLSADSSGNLYGFNYSGGKANYGTVFELKPSGGSWTFSLLYTFNGTSDGGNPVGAPLLDKAGNLYGDTQAGGNYAYCAFTAQQNGCGVVFKVSRSKGKSTESVVHIFTDGVTQQNDDGAFPAAGLIFGPFGDIYGTTQIGGTGQCLSGKGNDLGCGTAFSVTP
jgi:uncharacterized repeat protein (TIGR03803 family)